MEAARRLAAGGVLISALFFFLRLIVFAHRYVSKIKRQLLFCPLHHSNVSVSMKAFLPAYSCSSYNDIHDTSHICQTLCFLFPLASSGYVNESLLI